MDVMTVPFDPKLFVDRKKERKLFFNVVRATAERTYLEFNGVAGQGKSELLKWIYHQAKQEKYYCAYIDFEVAEYHHKEIYPILEAIADHLSLQISPEVFKSFRKKLPLYREELKRFYRDSLEKPQVDRRPLEELENSLIKAFNNDLGAILKSHKIVLCLDSTEKAYSLALSSFEDQVLTQHTKHRNFILVTAGQEEVVWKNAEIRELVKRYGLSRLDSQGVQAQVNSLAEKKGFKVEHSDLVLDKLLKLTLGHPFSNYKLIDFWTDGFKWTLDKTVVEDEKRFAQSIRKLRKWVVEERILEKFQLSEEYPAAMEILWYLAPLRHIELSTFRYVLSTFLEDRFQERPFIFFQELIGEFQKTYIFTRWRLGRGFDLEPVVRNILLWDMRINAQKNFIKIQEKLTTHYDNWVKQTRDATQIKNIVERLYHYATYLRETQPKNINVPVQEKLKDYLQTYFTEEFTGSEEALHDQLNRLYNALENDKELSDITDVSALLHMMKKRMA